MNTFLLNPFPITINLQTNSTNQIQELQLDSQTMEARENEIINYFKVWLQVIPCLCYCFLIGKLLPPNKPFLRLFPLLPVIYLFLRLPLDLHSVHLTGTFAFFIAWLANFKLLLFAFGHGPLSHPSLSLKRFIALASFPIKILENPSHHKLQNGHSQSLNSNKSLFNYGVKIVILALMLKSYQYSHDFHPKLLLVLYSLHIYILLEMILVVVAAMARTLLGIELEPPFNEPYLSSSLQDFWGRRWNMMVTKILRPTVYEPAYGLALRVVGRKWASLPAVFATFLVSGLYHELIFYYLGRVRPTWEITWFFLLHGFCLIVEIGLKKKLTGKLRLPRVISGPLTVGFVMITAFWLFFPQLLRFKGDERALEEYAAVVVFVKNVTHALTFKA